MRPSLALRDLFNRRPNLRLPPTRLTFMDPESSTSTNPPPPQPYRFNDRDHPPRRSASPPFRRDDRERYNSGMGSRSGGNDRRWNIPDQYRTGGDLNGRADGYRRSPPRPQTPERRDRQENYVAKVPALKVAVEENPTLALFTFRGTKAEVRKRKRSTKRPLPEPYSAEDVLSHDIKDLLGEAYVNEVLGKEDESEWTPPESLKRGESATLRVSAFTVSGESLSIYQDEGSSTKWAVVTPFAHPGDLIKCIIYKHDRFHSLARLEEIIEYSEEYRGGEGDRRKFPDQGCKYFGKCGGCQLQPIPYDHQLAMKKRTVELAYKRFSLLDDLPSVRDTIPSPKQWAYRTKITPHFDEVPKRIKTIMGTAEYGKKIKDYSEAHILKVLEDGKDKDDEYKPWSLNIGFNDVGGGSRTLDIEECPIATPILNDKMALERSRVKDSILSFPRGATLLLRDSLVPPPPTSLKPFDPSKPMSEEHIAVVDHKKPVYERVGAKMFTFSAGSFFQNNNSILPSLAAYVKEAIFPAEPAEGSKKPTHLVDAYCGSGFFGISLADSFERVAGVELDTQAVQAAQENAAINELKEKTTWLCGQAEVIFGGLRAAGFAGSHSCVIIDPPRKGCDELFLQQLYAFRPITIVYVSCNVHTQARDIGWFIHKAKGRGVTYNLESIRGFDLFPQTAHVESVAVLRLVQT